MKARKGHVSDEVVRCKRSLMTSLALLALVMAGSVAFAMTGGIDLVSDILGGAALEGEIIAPLPPAGTTTPTVEATPSVPATASAAVTTPAQPGPAGETTQPPAAEPVEQDAEASGPTTGPMATIYREQHASQAELARLVRGDIVAITLGPVTPGSASARFSATISYRDGSSAPAVLGLRRSDDVWYLASLVRVELPEGGSGVEVDPAVTSAMVAAQPASPDLLSALVAGTYFRLEFDGVTPMPAGASVALRMTGARGAAAEGVVTCTTSDGGAWFITSLAQR